MSGVEILGVAAGVLQIAELGGKLSVKLFTFTRKIKNADKHIDNISQDIAATGAVLQELGNELKKDEHLRLCSPEAVAEARKLMLACRGVFDELNDAIDGKGKVRGAGKWLALKRGINYTFVEDQILLLKAKLEHLKSSLLVILNVLIFAGQMKGNEALPVLQDQRLLLKQLVEDKLHNQRQFDLLLKRLDQMTVSAGDDNSLLSKDKDLSRTASSVINLVNTSASIASVPAEDEKDLLTPHLPMHLHDRAEEIFDHCRLVRALIEEVNHVQYKLDLGIKYRAQQKILENHYDEWEKHLAEHESDKPPHVRYKCFEKHPALKRYWTNQPARKKAVATTTEKDLENGDAKRETLSFADGWSPGTATGSQETLSAIADPTLSNSAATAKKGESTPEQRQAQASMINDYPLLARHDLHPHVQGSYQTSPQSTWSGPLTSLSASTVTHAATRHDDDRYGQC